MNNGGLPAMGGMIPRDARLIQQEEALSKTRAERYTYREGLTKREHYAGLAMQGLIAADSEAYVNCSNIAQMAVDMADALLKELDK